MKSPHRSVARTATRLARQRGATLIEGMVAITIFSFGILAVVGMLATHMGTANDARYRVEAAQYAESIIADMRLSKVSDTQLRTDFSAGGDKFKLWDARLKAAGALPMAGASADVLTITFSQDMSVMTLTIRWRGPSDRVSEPHQYVTSTYI